MMQELKMRRSAQISDGGFTQKRRFFRVCLGAVFRPCSAVFASAKGMVTAKRFLALFCAGLLSACSSLDTDGLTNKPYSSGKRLDPNCDHYATSGDSGSCAPTRQWYPKGK